MTQNELLEIIAGLLHAMKRDVRNNDDIELDEHLEGLSHCIKMYRNEEYTDCERVMAD